MYFKKLEILKFFLVVVYIVLSLSVIRLSLRAAFCKENVFESFYCEDCVTRYNQIYPFLSSSHFNEDVWLNKTRKVCLPP